MNSCARVFRPCIARCLLLVAGIALPVTATAGISARSLALGGSVVADARGTEAVAWNPAGVYMRGARPQLDLFAVSTQVQNNSFSIGDYNRYTGAYLDDADKDYILDRIPADGLRLDAYASAHAVSFWASPVAVTFGSDAVAEGRLSRDAAELLLFGNASFDSVDLAGTGGATQVTAGVSFTYARPVTTVAGGTLSAGITARYLKGLYVQEVIESEGHIVTKTTGIDGDAYLVARTAHDGTGLAADLGLLFDYGNGWQFGASVINLLGRVQWQGSPEAHEFTFTVDSLSILNAEDDDVIQSQDRTYAIEPFSTRLPATLRLGAAHTTGSMTWLAQWEQGLNRVAGAYTSPRISGGLEWWAGRKIPLRGGLSLGAGNVSASVGTGVHTGLLFVDIGFGLASGPTWNTAKGFELAVNTGFRF